MKKDSKQRLFEVMQRVNPDFVIKEDDSEEQSQQVSPEYYSQIELAVLNRIAHTIRFVHMNPHMAIQNPATFDVVYNYNQKHGNVIKAPLIQATKDELIEYLISFLISLYAIKKIKPLDDNQLKPYLDKLNYDEIIKFVEKEYQEYLKTVYEYLETKNVGTDVINRALQERKRQYDYIIMQLKRTYKYSNAEIVSVQEINFIEQYPVAEPFDADESGRKKYASEDIINATKSLVNRGVIIVIPLNQEEIAETGKIYTRSLDYLTPTWGYGDVGYAHVVLLKDHNEIINMHDEYTIANFKFTKQYLDDLFVTALEGGSNYWAAFDLKDIAPKSVDPRPISEKVIDAVWTFKKSIPVYDMETGDIDLTSPWVRISAKEYNDRTEDFFVKHGFEKVGELNIKGVFNAMAILKEDERYSHILRNIATENYDANDADAFFQLAIMGEIVYG